MFTTARNNMMKFMDSGCHAEIIDSRFEDVKRTYLKVQEQHEEYLCLLEESGDIDTTTNLQNWMDEVDEEFNKVEMEKFSYMRKKEVVKEEPLVEDPRTKMEQALVMRRIEETAFKKQINDLEDLIKKEEATDDPMLNLVNVVKHLIEAT